MITKLWNWLTDNKGADKEQESVNQKEEYISPDSINNEEIFSFDNIEDPEIINNGVTKSILFMDDLENQFDLYKIDFNRMKYNYKFDINEHYNIINCRGEFAGFIAWKYIQNNHVDVAILDITLGKSVKLENGKYLAYDGIDIGLEFEKYSKSTIYKFCTAHPLNRKNREIHSFIDKFEKNSNKDIYDYYFNKNDERYKTIYEMIQLDMNKG